MTTPTGWRARLATPARALAAALAAAATVAACGGGGGAEGGIGGTGNSGDGVSYGTITGFGSIFVNGTEFRTSGATIRLDDNSSVGEDRLRVGMVVRVDGSIAGATARTVTVDDAIKGRVERGLVDGTLLVMGQTVQIDAATRLDNNVVPLAGDLVEVHGLVAGDGVVAAGYIERKTALAGFAVKGIVRDHDTAAQTLRIGTLAVRYVGAVTRDMPAGSWNGLQVDVKGSACANTSGACGTLTATQVEPAGANVAAAPAAEVEGIVVAIAADGFTIGNQRVVTNGSTRYENGVAADVTVGTKVEAEGAISGGVLTATKVSIRDSVRLEADVAGVDAAAGTLTLAGLPGITVSTTMATQFKNVTAVANLAAGNHLRLRGRPGLGNGVVATELELRDTRPDPRVELRAAVQAIVGNTLTLQGVIVDTSAIGNAGFKDTADASIGRTAFFAGIRVGSVVKVRGARSGTTVAWSEAEIETP